ncbi:MAG: type II toxin-antitoxin system VapC family toxin [Desulfobacterales bacterium]|nr:type II toxin-antitoxin system VapC family toxin [Desulfobacterales bacterium]
MKNVLIDTNIYSHAMRGDPDTIYVLQKAREVAICTISIGELLSGFKGGSREQENRGELDEFLDAPRVQIHHIDENTAEFYAEILNTLKEKGTPIPTNDIWIAAVAFQHGLRLFSKDGHFENIPGLMLAS